MSYPILTSKLIMPDTGLLVSRTGLIAQLDNYSKQPLTLVIAPAGYGKTSLVCNWLSHASSPIRYCWLSVDQKNNIPSSFWSYFCATLHNISPAITRQAECLLSQNTISDFHLIVDSILSALEKLTRQWNRPPKLAIVLDDFHHIDTPDILEPLNRFIDYMPDWINLVITSRALPKLSVPHRVSKLKANILGREELALKEDQIAVFLKEKLSVVLNQRQLSHLFNKTEGWVTAIQLTGLAIKSGHNFSNISELLQLQHGQHLSNFLFEEVYLNLKENTKQLLCGISVTENFCADIANEIMQSTDSQAVIEELIKADLFISIVDKKDAWYRLHSLFKDWLTEKVRRQDPNSYQSYQNRAMKWLEEHNRPEEALAIAFQLNNWEKAASLTFKLYPSLVKLGHFDHASDTLNYFPENIIQRVPHLSTLRAIINFSQFQYSTAMEHLQFAEESLATFNHDYPEISTPGRGQALVTLGLKSEDDLSLIMTGLKLLQSQVARFNGNSRLARSLEKDIQKSHQTDDSLSCWIHYGAAADYFMNDEISLCITHGEKALNLAKESKDGLCVISALCWLLHALHNNGKPLKAIQIAEHNIVWLKQHGLLNLSGVSALYSAIINIQLELNQIDKAWANYRLLVNNIESNTESREISFSQKYTYVNLLSASRLFHKAKQALEDLLKYEEDHFPDSGASGEYNYSVFLDSTTLEPLIELKQGNFFPIILWTNTIPKMETHACLFRYEYERFIYAVGKMLAGQEESDLLTDIQEKAEKRGVTSRLVNTYLLQAKITFSQDGLDQAMRYFSSALKLAAPCGYVNLIIGDAQIVKPLLQEASLKGIESNYCEKLLHEIEHQKQYQWEPGHEELNPTQKTDPFEKINTNKSDLIEPLSPRELDVMSLLNKGARNKDISAQLNLSLSTVKRHLQNIYAKLQVNSRTEAILVAKTHLPIKKHEIELPQSE